MLWWHGHPGRDYSRAGRPGLEFTPNKPWASVTGGCRRPSRLRGDAPLDTETPLSRGWFDGIIDMHEMLRAALSFLDENMARILLHSRRILAASVLLLLVGVVALSTATRRPCLEGSTGPWHTWKAGHMTTAEGQEACKLRVTAEVNTLQAAPQESPAPAPSIYLPHEETIPPALPLIAQIRHFRAPPTLG